MTPLNLARYRRPYPPCTPNRRKKNSYVAALKRDGYRCTMCPSYANLTIHHRTPRAEGGNDDLDNLQTLCAKCHIAVHRPLVAA